MIKLSLSTALAVLSFSLTHAWGAETAPVEEKPDLLNFLNGDFLHGTFQGVENGNTLLWKHPDVPEAIRLETGKIRRVALHEERAAIGTDSYSYARLSNGDRIPGRIVSLDDDELVVSTNFAGDLVFPRNTVSQLGPNPYGGKVTYLGPFSKEGWTILSKEKDEADPEDEAEDEAPGEAPDPNADEEEENVLAEDPWIFSGAAWYSNGMLPLALDAKLPETALISFNLSWKNRLNASVAFHATLEVPEPVAKKEDANEAPDQDPDKKPAAPRVRVARQAVLPRQQTGTTAYPQTYGASYVLTLYSSYAQLYRCSFDEDGKSHSQRLSSSGSNIRLTDSGETNFEVRCDQKEAQISLYANGKFVTQWTDPKGYAGTGTHLAFASQNSETQLRVSDVVACSWNGMMDSALSMKSKDRDVILLSNGTDRFSGSVSAIKDDTLFLDGTFGEMEIPMSDVQEVHFASETVAEAPDLSKQALRLILQPVGRLTVEPQQATPSLLTGSMHGTDVSIDLNHVDLMEFTFGESALDSWDDDF